MSRIVAVVLFLFFAFAGAKSPSMADVDSVSDNAEAAAKLYLTAVEKLPAADVAGANARSVASFEADLVAETVAVAAALPCPECAHDYTALCPRGLFFIMLCVVRIPCVWCVLDTKVAR
jgi:hypothetical protein